MLVRIRDYNTQDIIDGIKLLLDRAAHSEEVRTLAVQLTHDRQDKIAAIYDWIKQNVSYVPDPIDIELFISPIKQVKDYNSGLGIAGDCDDMAILATSLYRAIGIKSNVVLYNLNGQGLDHAASRAWSDKINQWIIVDPSSEFPLGWGFPFYTRLIVD